MPLTRCQDKGEQGWKWGASGHCYTGPNAKEDALRQGRAIEMSKHAKGEASELSEVEKELVSFDIGKYLHGESYNVDQV